jgi:geranylgeranyl diphosphate synthase type I
VGSDVRQGKKTLLVVKAFERATKKQKEVLNKCLGNKDLTEEELDEFREIIIDTGSLAYARKLAEDLIAQSKKEIAKADIELEAKDFLLDIAEYMLNREV